MAVALLILAALVPIAALVFIIATDGRYFGKAISSWVYDRLGPSIFSIRSEAPRWKTLYSELQLTGMEHVLDVGTAIGDLPNSFASQPGFEGLVVGIDLSESLIAKAKARSHLEGLGERSGFSIADLTRGLPFRSGTFEVVICLGLLETIRRPDSAVAELKRVLVPKGQLVLSVYRGGAALVAALGEASYLDCIGPERVSDYRLVPLRRSQDVLIVRLNEMQRGS